MTIRFKLSLAISILLVISILSEPASVSSIYPDLESMKIVVVNIKPGQSPFSRAFKFNGMSKKKSPSFVKFQSGDRLVGEAEYPCKDKMEAFEYVKNLVGLLPSDLFEVSRGAFGTRIEDDATVYSTEDLLAMILRYGRNLAELYSKVAIKDAIIRVPTYFGQAELEVLLRAAQLAGINVLSLINEYFGPAFEYEIGNLDFDKLSWHVMFYDMGSSCPYADLAFFLAENAIEFLKTDSVNQFQAQEWLYSDGEDALVTEFQEGPFRLNELPAWPTTSGHAQRYHGEFQQDVGKISIEQEYRSFIKKLEEFQAQELLYSDGEDALVTEFQDGVFRLNELIARPTTSGHAQRYLGEFQQDIGKYSIEQERHSFIKKLEEAQELLYSDGEDALVTEFRDGVFRLNELTARLAASVHVQRYLGEFQQVTNNKKIPN